MLNSELILNSDGSIFHLHLKPNQLATTIILVGDPKRSDTIATYFNKLERRTENREFVTNTGTYNNKRISVISTGIGCDNIDIVMTEIDALFNVDFQTKTIKNKLTKLTIIRLGTSGTIQKDINVGDYVISEISIGIEGLLHFYDNASVIREIELENEFIKQTNWNTNCSRPYAVRNNQELVKLFAPIGKKGVTISAGGFYAPQGRVIRLPLSQNNYLAKLEQFSFNGLKILNIEMESAAIAALGSLLGHHTITLCTIIAQRITGESKSNYDIFVEKMIRKTLHLLTK